MSKTLISAGEVYAFTKAPDIGSFLILIDFNMKTKMVGCLSLPGMQNCCFTVDELFELQDSNIIDPVDCLPDDVFAVCKEHFDASHSETKKTLERLLCNEDFDFCDKYTVTETHPKDV